MIDIIKESKELILHSGAFKNIIYIGITGSIGRNEKSITDKNKNDVDFFVIAEDVNAILKNKIEKKLQILTEAKFTDILYLNSQKILKKLNNKEIDQYLYDIVNGNMTLYSTNNFFEEFKKRKYDISFLSAQEVLLSRLWALVVPYQIKDNKVIPMKNEDFSLYQMKKAYGAIIDSILISEKKYFSPLKEIKLLNFKDTSFYFKYKKENDILLQYKYQKYNYNIFKCLIDLYCRVIYDLIDSKLNLITYPRKKLVLKSLFLKKDKIYINNMYLKFNQMNNLNKFIKNEVIDINSFNTINSQLYKDIIE